MNLVSTEPKSIKFGTTDIKKVYLGSTQVRPNIKEIDFLLIGAGGYGGYSNTSYNCYLSYGCGGGGGGAGGVVYCEGYAASLGTYNVVVGRSACDSENSCFGDMVAYHGGRGGTGSYYSGSQRPGTAGCNGGSGGGGGTCNCAGGLGCSGQGNNGGNASDIGGGGGGGYGGAGCGPKGYPNCRAGDGGLGFMSDISGATQCYAGGGGGGLQNKCGYGYTRGLGCYGGGNGGCMSDGCPATTCGSGGGGGGKGTGGSGGGGLFIVRYPTACGYDITGGTKYTCGNYTIHCFTSNGTLTVN